MATEELRESESEMDDREPTDVRVTEDESGNICISDLFVMAGRPETADRTIGIAARAPRRLKRR